MDEAALQAERSAIRAAMRAWRMRVPEAGHREASHRAGMNLEEVPAFKQARVVAGYRPTRGELDPGLALGRVANAGAMVVWPRVMQDGVTIAFHRIRTPEDWVQGRFGIWEPAHDAPEITLDAITCFVVPGLAFDRGGGSSRAGRWSLRPVDGKGTCKRKTGIYRIRVRQPADFNRSAVAARRPGRLACQRG